MLRRYNASDEKKNEISNLLANQRTLHVMDCSKMQEVFTYTRLEFVCLITEKKRSRTQTAEPIKEEWTEVKEHSCGSG